MIDIIGVWKALFSTRPSAADVRVQLKGVEREWRREFQSLEIRERERERKIEDAKRAVQAGQEPVLRAIYVDLQQIEVERKECNRDLLRLGKMKAVLSLSARRLDRLERRRDQKGAEEFIKRMQSSRILEALDKGDIDEQAFVGLLDEVLGTAEVDATEDAGADPKFSEFAEAIGRLAAAERAGGNPGDLERERDRVDRSLGVKREAVLPGETDR